MVVMVLAMKVAAVCLVEGSEEGEKVLDRLEAMLDSAAATGVELMATAAYLGPWLAACARIVLHAADSHEHSWQRLR